MVIRFHYIGCGLPDIWLRNGFEVRSTGYGESVSIRDVEGLHRAIALELVDNRPELTGAEVRFLRTEMDLSQDQLAELLDVPLVSVRDWEENLSAVPGPAERLIRALYVESACGALRMRSLIDRIARLNRDACDARLEFEACKNGWKTAA